MTIDNLDRIAAKIETLSDAALSIRSSYLLSELGKDLGDDLKLLKDLTKSTLSNFVRDRLSHKFSIALTGEFRNVQALIRSAGSPEPVVASEPRIEGAISTDSPKQYPRFNYRFWAAFSVPFRGLKRFLNLEDLKFQELASADVPEGHLEVQESYIAAQGIQDRDKVIAENISRWIVDNGLNKSNFYQTKVPREVASVLPGLSLLEKVISALDSKQLSNTSMTLDVILTLMRKRV